MHDAECHSGEDHQENVNNALSVVVVVVVVIVVIVSCMK